MKTAKGGLQMIMQLMHVLETLTIEDCYTQRSMEVYQRFSLSSSSGWRSLIIMTRDSARRGRGGPSKAKDDADYRSGPQDDKQLYYLSPLLGGHQGTRK